MISISVVNSIAFSVVLTVSKVPDVHVKALMELFSSGVTIVNVHSGQPDHVSVIEFYDKHVLSNVRA